MYNKYNSSFKMEIVTGKGNHSKGEALLYPEIKKMLRKSNHQIIQAKKGSLIYKLIF